MAAPALLIGDTCMMLSRRTMLKLTGAACLGIPHLPGRLQAASAAKPFFLVLDDITEDTTADAVATFLSPFAVRGIPAGFLIKPRADTGAERALPSPVGATLNSYMRGSPALGEALAWVPDLADTPPYFQIRAAGVARTRVAAFLGFGPGNGPSTPPILTIAAENRPGSVPLAAVRSAGFRNVILLSERSGSTASDRCEGQTACLRGAVRRSITDGIYETIAAIAGAAAGGDLALLSLSLAGIGDIAPDVLALRAEALADSLAADISAGRIFASLPSEHVFWFGAGSERLICLHVEAPPKADLAANVAYTVFQSALRDAVIPFSRPASETENPDLADPVLDDMGCRGIVNVAVQDPADGPRSVACLGPASLPPESRIRLAAAGYEAILRPPGTTGNQMDENGVFHLAADLILDGQQGAMQDIGAFGPAQDIVVSIAPAAYGDAAARAAVIAMLNEARSTSPTTVLGVPGFARAVLPDDPVYQLMLTTRRDRPQAAPAAPALTGAARDVLIEDARIAWSFVTRMTDKTTGLCPSTVSFDDDGGSVYGVLTMWDMASQIQATIAAHELGLMGDTEFGVRAQELLRALPAERISGLVLPSSEIATGSLTTVSRDYNACDTGRLLSALAELNRYPPTKGTCDDKVARWDLKLTLRDGRLNSIIAGSYEPLYQSHCAPYAARAFALWGVLAASPYADAFQGDSVTDAKMSLLYQVARIGPLGAEPLLLEGVEMGLLAPSDYLADLLLAAQARSHTATGTFVAASEGPLDRAPWFTYQGLRVDLNGDKWDVLSIDAAPAFQTEDFRRSSRVLSTKAAFLWAAMRPGAYSNALLDYVRSRARASQAGYSAGIYSATGSVMQDYSDINTNGIILQAVAYILRGHAPRFPLAQR
jgi:hypothetical protein